MVFEKPFLKARGFGVAVPAGAFFVQGTNTLFKSKVLRCRGSRRGFFFQGKNTLFKSKLAGWGNWAPEAGGTGRRVLGEPGSAHGCDSALRY